MSGENNVQVAYFRRNNVQVAYVKNNVQVTYVLIKYNEQVAMSGENAQEISILSELHNLCA